MDNPRFSLSATVLPSPTTLHQSPLQPLSTVIIYHCHLFLFSYKRNLTCWSSQVITRLSRDPTLSNFNGALLVTGGCLSHDYSYYSHSYHLYYTVWLFTLYHFAIPFCLDLFYTFYTVINYDSLLPCCLHSAPQHSHDRNPAESLH